MPKPFGKIALSLSGGGVRAVGYHAGALSFLDLIKYDAENDGNLVSILEDVGTLSTVSGGTLVGMGYAAEIKEGNTFHDFYHILRNDLQDNYHFVGRLMEGLNTGPAPGPAGRRYLISAYADLFKNGFRFFANRRFEIFFRPNPEIHLETVIFNSLETYFGQGFRFQRSALGGESGSSKVRLPEEFARKALLADIMAASSDLPGAFAPIEFPDDFHWPRDIEPDPYNHDRPDLEPIWDSINQEFQDNGGETDTTKITLLDGGAYDNQGISAVISWLRSTHLAESGDAFRRIIRLDALQPEAVDTDLLESRRIALESLDASSGSGNDRMGFWGRIQSRSHPERGMLAIPDRFIEFMVRI